MIEAHKPRPSLQQVRHLLGSRHDDAIEALEPLSGGFWSSAYSYRFAGQDLVLRIGDMRDGFLMDSAAMKFASVNFPVPVVVEIGDFENWFFAISRRHYGCFIETIVTSFRSQLRILVGTSGQGMIINLSLWPMPLNKFFKGVPCQLSEAGSEF